MNAASSLRALAILFVSSGSAMAQMDYMEHADVKVSHNHTNNAPDTQEPYSLGFITAPGADGMLVTGVQVTPPPTTLLPLQILLPASFAIDWWFIDGDDNPFGGGFLGDYPFQISIGGMVDSFTITYSNVPSTEFALVTFPATGGCISAFELNPIFTWNAITTWPAGADIHIEMYDITAETDLPKFAPVSISATSWTLPISMVSLIPGHSYQFEISVGLKVTSGQVSASGDSFIAGQDYTETNSIFFSVAHDVTVFADFCNGDGGDQMGCTNCPCSNNASIGTTGGCLNSAGASARLMATGDASVSLPSASLTDLRFSISGAPPSAFCILTSGVCLAPRNILNPCFSLNSGVQSLSFDGLRCAVVNTRRHGGRSADLNGDVGLTNNPWGGEGRPPIGLAQAFGGFAAGDTRYFQVINRDDPLASCMRALNTSQAVGVTFGP